MTAEEMLNSDDIETAQLAANIIYREKGRGNLVKILGKGELKSKVTISAHKFSASAKSAIEANGGVCTEI